MTFDVVGQLVPKGVISRAAVLYAAAIVASLRTGAETDVVSAGAQAVGISAEDECVQEVYDQLVRCARPVVGEPPTGAGAEGVAEVWAWCDSALGESLASFVLAQAALSLSPGDRAAGLIVGATRADQEEMTVRIAWTQTTEHAHEFNVPRNFDLAALDVDTLADYSDGSREHAVVAREVDCLSPALPDPAAPALGWS